MKRLILTTVGTSIFDETKHKGNCEFSVCGGEAFRKTCDNAQKAGLTSRDALLGRWEGPYATQLGNQESVWLDMQATATCGDGDKVWALSAELSSLKLLDPRPGEGDRLVLLATDTVQGAVAARRAALHGSTSPEVLVWKEGVHWPESCDDCSACLADASDRVRDEHGPRFPRASVQVMIIEGLTWDPRDRTNRRPADDFRDQGCYNLAAALTSIIAYERDEYSIVCNVTGGLKSAIPFMTWVAALDRGLFKREAELMYLYEYSETLLRTRLPALVLPPEVFEFFKDPSCPDATPDHARIQDVQDYYELSAGKWHLTSFGQVVKSAVKIKVARDDLCPQP